MNIDEDYTKPVLNLMRKALKGNGVPSGNVSVKSFDGAILKFTATTHIKLNNKISEKIVPGKAPGADIFQNRQAAYKGAEGYVSSALQKPQFIEQIKNLITQKPHHGFGLNNEIIKLPFLDREFISHDPCHPCHGKGSTKCTKCRGKGHQPCHHCNAQGFQKCNECHGNRQIRGPQGQMQTCHLCGGSGKESCSFCRENRQIQCGACRTKGEIQCRTCSGKGNQSNIVKAEITAQCTYDFDAGALPNNAATVVKNLGADLAEQAKIKPVTKERKDNKQDALHLFYEVCVPQGSIEFAIKDQIVQAYLFGTEGTIKEIPDFLDGIIAPGVKNLAQAASGQGNIGENIRAAVKYKTIRRAVMVATRYNSKKAVKALLHYTPLGLSIRAAQNLVEDANTALNNATKQKRTMATVFGIGSGIALTALYLLSPLRPTLLAQISNTTLHIPINCVVLSLCAAVGYGVWQAISSRARKQALESLLSSK